MKITVDIDKVDKLVKDGENIVVTPEAESEIVTLLELQITIENAIEQVKQNIEKKALELNPNFRSLQSDRVKAFYREYGSRYYIDEKDLAMTPKELYEVEEKVSYKIDSKAVEKWVKEHGGMPVGIKEVDRKKTMSISLK